MLQEIAAFIECVTNRIEHIETIWLIGSRANGSSRVDSDWDFIAFGNEEAFRSLQNERGLHRSDIDFLVVVNGNDFRNSWGNQDKTGSLSRWEWKLISDTIAEYTEARWIDGAGVVSTRKKAIRVWPYHPIAP